MRVGRGRHSASRAVISGVVAALALLVLAAPTAGRQAGPVAEARRPFGEVDGRRLGAAPDRPTAVPPGLDRGRDAATRAVEDWIDTSDRAAVLAAFNAEFDRVEPPSGWTGNLDSCQPGTTTQAFKQSVIQRINWYRAMAGVGGPVSLDSAMSTQSQAAALMMSANSDLSHDPPDTWNCWTEAGYEGASHSNLALGASGISAVDAYMEDFGDNNTRAGHRWWLLQPWAVRMGTGDVPAPQPANAIHVVDDANYSPGSGEMRDPDRFFSWPPPGYVPADVVWPRWSLYKDEAGSSTDMSNATVQVTVEGRSVPVTVDHRSQDRIVFVPQISDTGDVDVSVTVSGIDVDGTSTSKSWTTTVIGASEYVPITPCRVADSRGGPSFGPYSGAWITVAGTGPDFDAQGGRPGGCGIPETATAVEASISAVSPSASGYLRVWPGFETEPTATFLNYTARKGTTNTGAVPLGYGSLSLGNHVGRTHVVVDVQGYYTASEPGARYFSLTPCRLADTRLSGGAFLPNVQRSYRVTGTGSEFEAQGGRSNGCGIPAGASAIEASVTAVSPTRANGYLRLWPSGGAAPTATFLNYVRGEGITNTGAVPLAAGDSPHLNLRNYGGTTHQVIDVQGYFSTTGPGARYVPITPCRLVDTRSAGGALSAGGQRSYRVTGNGSEFVAQGGRANGCGVPTGASAIEASVTAVSPTRANGFVRIWPAGEPVPGATFLNYTRGQSTTNTGAVGLAPAGTSQLSLRNFGGSSNIVIDVQGYYVTG
ncbi:MAG: CAP domain-containing protein [Acidimicrobiales bacterium]|nr:CAP domain-containing protein [Acidimicrobiales bacterium]